MRLIVQEALVYLCLPNQIVLLHDISFVPMKGETVIFNNVHFVVESVINRFDLHHDGTLDYKIDIVCTSNLADGLYYENPNGTMVRIDE
jgi:hypothetical protein